MAVAPGINPYFKGIGKQGHIQAGTGDGTVCECAHKQNKCARSVA